MGGMLLLILGIFFFTRNLFRFEKVSRFEAVILPVYSLIMAWLALDQHHPSVMAISVTAIFGVLMAWLQSWGARVKVTGKQDKHDRPVVEVRRGWWYLIGWLLIFAYGIVFAVMLGEHVNILEEAGNEIAKDLFSFRNFSTASSWNIYLQSGIASLVYTLLLVHKEPKVKHAIARRQRHKK
ncbi:hydrophobic protein [Lacticaseibacillus saniviri]